MLGRPSFEILTCYFFCMALAEKNNVYTYSLMSKYDEIISRRRKFFPSRELFSRTREYFFFQAKKYLLIE